MNVVGGGGGRLPRAGALLGAALMVRGGGRLGLITRMVWTLMDF